MPKDMEVKGFGPFEIKDEARGEVSAVVASMDTPDRDGDVLLSGSIRSGNRVKLSGWGHDVVLANAPPVGVGTITERDGKAVFEGRFFMSTARGADAFHTLKELGGDGEWSYGFRRSEAETADLTEEWRAKGARRVYKDVNPIEASPVFMPAGFGTGTLSVKAEGSLTQRMDAVNAALMDRNEGTDPEAWWWAKEVFEDHVIVEAAGSLLRVPYEIGDDGAATIHGTNAVQVEVEYREVASDEGEGDEETRSAEEQAAVKALRALQKEKKLTDAELAEALEVKEAEVGPILAGEAPLPDLDTLAAVTEKLSADVQEAEAKQAEDAEVEAELERFRKNREWAEALEAKRAAEEALETATARVEELKAQREADQEFQRAASEAASEFNRIQRTARRLGVV